MPRPFQYFRNIICICPHSRPYYKTGKTIRMIETIAYPRAALIGNPSDGYNGRTIAFVFKDFAARVQLTPSDLLQIVPCDRDRIAFSNINEFTEEIEEFGYYGGVRLIKATIKRFHNYCQEQGIALHDRNFTISYATDIPHRLGLAGSSAIVTAAMKALMQFYGVDIPRPLLANLILSVERDELKIGAGLQDRVAQVYGCPVYMDFDQRLMELQGYGEYVPFDKAMLPLLYLAYRTSLSEGSEVTHNRLAARHAMGEPAVLAAIEHWKQLTSQFWDRLKSGNKNVADLMDLNFDVRSKVVAISKGNKALIDAARGVGASAKFTGSGGAIIGTFTDQVMFHEIEKAMAKVGAVAIIPNIA